MKPERLRLALLGAAALSLAGCVVVPYRGPGYAYSSEPGPVVDSQPPPPQVEVMPVAPGPGYVWIGGHWGWNLGRHVWIGGRWMLPPAGYAWVPGYWGRHDRGWRWHGGYWGRR